MPISTSRNGVLFMPAMKKPGGELPSGFAFLRGAVSDAVSVIQLSSACSCLAIRLAVALVAGLPCSSSTLTMLLLP